jgi:hypothetical protein
MNLTKRFNEWMYLDVYPVEGQNRSCFIRDNTDLSVLANRDYWMRAAYMAGAQAQLEEFNKRIKIMWEEDQNEN